ncbi:MAG TPA: trypsin-like peptidase domain-containing protein [Pseudomonadales bacterium]
MKKLLAFIFWPALAGLVFAFTLLQAPRLVDVMPGLAAYFPQPAAGREPTSLNALSFNDAIRKSAPAVVSINFKEDAERIMQRLENDVFQSVEDDDARLGSGVIVRPDGYIITSYHVVFSDASQRAFWSREWIVTLENGSNLEARIVSLDEANDLALLKVDAGHELPSLTLADPGTLRVGDVVLAIGNPRNIGQSVTQGIISAFRGLDGGYIIQTDAAINPGNSGGALINTDGELIGINSTIVSQSGGSEGISFSIPAEKAIGLLENYLASGPSGYLGVSASLLTLDQIRPASAQDVQGFLVNEVGANSPAEQAGIRPGDIIAGIGGQRLNIRNPRDEAEAHAAMSAISDLDPGTRIVLEIYRDGRFIELPAILGVGEPQIYEVPLEADPTPRLSLPN